MNRILLLIFGCVCLSAYGQFHDNNIPKIESVDAAKEYADRYREVSVNLVNSEMDVFLFDEVDTGNMKASVGKISTIYRRRTKFLKDTVVTLVNVQTIEFDHDKISIDSANVLIDEIIKKYNAGTSYWNLMKQYRSESCKFNSGPSPTELLKKRYGCTLEDRKKDEIFKWSYSNRPSLPIIIIINEEAHPVPAFWAISYNVAG